MIRPNFFIVGAPKCGTTALSDYLRKHPQIFVSEPKEPHYFAKDLEQYRITKSLTEYLDLFANCQPNCLAVGEASVFYLYSDVAIKNIYQFNPDAKIIIMVRKPQDMVYSFHSQLIYTADENEADFPKAWQLQAARKQQQNLPDLCRAPALLQYAEIGKLGKQIARLLDIFPREQIQIILFDDFIKSTKEVYDRVLEFLEVPNDKQTDFEIINQNKVHKSALLGKFVAKPPVGLTNAVMGVKESLGIKELGIISMLKKINTQKSKRKPLSEDLKRELQATFKADIQQLSQLIERDLSHWLV